MGTISAMDAAWKQVKIGAGGWITGIDIAPDGTMVARTDTYGAYIWNGTGWTQLVTAGTMPANTFSNAGVYEIRVAASNSNIIYMETADGVFKSVDKGQSWNKTAFPSTMFNANSPNRMDGQKMAVDPTNPNVVFAGTQQNGLWVTRDGGSTWQKITAVPQGTDSDAALTGISIKGSTVFVGTGGSGVYSSTDGGVTWRSIGGPVDVSNAAIAPDGTYFAAGRQDGIIWRYANGAWTQGPGGVHAVAIDPFNASHIVVTGNDGHVQESRDGGNTWGDRNWNNSTDSTNDVPWLDNDGGSYLASGGLAFDPRVAGKLWQTGGVGVWSTDLPTTFTWGSPIVWQSHSMGIEQLVANKVIAGPGSDPVFASWDRPFFDMANPDAYATNYGGGGFSMGWSVDYASKTPGFMVGISDWWGSEDSGYSSDGGKTWQKFAGLPSWANSTLGGNIAASTSTNFIWVAAGNQAPAYTLDGGKTWANVNIPGISDYGQVYSNYYLDRTAVAADRVLANTFYLYDTGSGVYRTTDGGVTWNKVYSGQVAEWSYWNAKIETVPGAAGELFFTSGPQMVAGSSQPGTIPLMHSSDGAATWHEVSGVGATTFGFGAPATPGGPATVFIVGTVNGTWGVWYSTDDAKTWTQVGDHPMGSLDDIRTISGDMDQFGRVYVGFSGSGYAYLDIGVNGATTTVATPTNLTAPTTQTTITEAFNDAKGLALAAGALTNDKTPVLHGTLTASLAADQSVAIYRDGQKVGIATLGANGWSFTDPGATDGSHNYVARVESTNGLSGQSSASFNLRVDATAPTQSVALTAAADDFGSTVGSLASGAVTDDHSPLIKGTLSSALGSDETLIVYRDGVRLGAASVSGSSWSYADNNVADGQHSYAARVEDAAGNQGQSAAAFALQVKTALLTKAASVTAAVDDFGSVKGTLLSGAITDDTTPLLKGVLSAALGTGEQLVVYRDGVRLGAASVSGTDWSYSDKAVGKGAHVYTSQVEDVSGQKSVASNSFYLTMSTQKATKAAVMSSYSSEAVSASSDITTTSTATTSKTSIQKFSLASSDLLDTSNFVSSALSTTDATSAAGGSLKLGGATFDAKGAGALMGDDDQGLGQHAVLSHDIGLVGGWHEHGFMHLV